MTLVSGGLGGDAGARGVVLRQASDPLIPVVRGRLVTGYMTLVWRRRVSRFDLSWGLVPSDVTGLDFSSWLEPETEDVFSWDPGSLLKAGEVIGLEPGSLMGPEAGEVFGLDPASWLEQEGTAGKVSIAGGEGCCVPGSRMMEFKDTGASILIPSSEVSDSQVSSPRC